MFDYFEDIECNEQANSTVQCVNMSSAETDQMQSVQQKLSQMVSEIGDYCDIVNDRKKVRKEEISS